MSRSSRGRGSIPPADPRGGQKRRTRSALLATAARLIAMGQTPSVTEVADAADISRRTAYRYFPTQDQLLVEAALEGLRPEVETAVAAALSATSSGLSDIEQAELQLVATVHVMHRLAVEHAALLRTMIRLTTGRTTGTRPVRGYRRIEWLTSAVAPVRARLGRRRFARLISALVSCVGMDSLFLLQDTQGLTPAAAERVTLWTAQVLLAASLAEAEGDR